MKLKIFRILFFLILFNSSLRAINAQDTSPVKIPGYPTPVAGAQGFLANPNLTIGEIVGKVLVYVYVIAGLALLLVLISGGISLMTAAGNPDKIKIGYAQITNALIGFLIVFISYMVTQLIEVVLGIKIL